MTSGTPSRDIEGSGPSSGEAPFDERALRRAFGAFTTGVTIATTLDGDGKPWGFTANSFTSVSLDPPLLLVCLAKTAGSYEAFLKAEHFAINVLSAAQRDASVAFATLGARKFDAVPWRKEKSGAPVLDGVVAWFDCALEQVVEAGDHAILIGRVLAFDSNGEEPLAYCRGAYLSFELNRMALRAAEDSGHLSVAAIVERGDTIFLLNDPVSDRLSLPRAPRFGRPDDPESLIGLLKKEGVSARLPFLFAVYEESGKEVVVYRGEAVGEIVNPGGNRRFFALDDLPWDRIVDPALKSMLERYRRERKASAFGLYIGTAEEGAVEPLPEEEERS